MTAQIRQNRKVIPSGGGASLMVVKRTTTTFTVPHNTPTLILWETVAYDTGDGAFSWDIGTADSIVVNDAGLYVITGGADFNVNSTGQREVQVAGNGEPDSAIQSVPAVSGDDTQITVSFPCWLDANSFVNVQVFQTSGGDLDVYKFDPTFLSVLKVA